MTTTTDPYTVIAQLKQAGENQAREIDALKRQLAVFRSPDTTPTTPISEMVLREAVLHVMARHAGETVDAFTDAQRTAWTNEARDIVSAVRLHDWKHAPASAWTTERPFEPHVYFVREVATAKRDPWRFTVVRLYEDGEVSALGTDLTRSINEYLEGDYEWQRAEPRP